MDGECFYCRRPTAAADRRTHTVELFRDHKLTYFVVGTHERELRTTMRIPCCDDCLRFIKRGKAVRSRHANLVVFSGIAGVVALFCAVVNDYMPIWVRVVVVLVPALVFAYAVRLSRLRVNAEVEQLLSGERRSTYEYPPFRALIDDGWAPRPGERTI